MAPTMSSAEFAARADGKATARTATYRKITRNHEQARSGRRFISTLQIKNRIRSCNITEHNGKLLPKVAILFESKRFT